MDTDSEAAKLKKNEYINYKIEKHIKYEYTYVYVLCIC